MPGLLLKVWRFIVGQKVSAKSEAESANSSPPPASRKALNRAIGNLGEDAVAAHLRRCGARILSRNYRCRGGEVDIITEHAGTIIFVEVKTRSPRAYFAPEEAVDEVKRDRLRHAARRYLSKYREPSPHRFDVASVVLDENDRVVSLEIIESAFAD